MAKEMTLQYDREADILYLNTIPPYNEQETEEMGDDIIVRCNPNTGAIETIEILFFSTRLLRSDIFSLPIDAALQKLKSVS